MLTPAQHRTLRRLGAATLHDNLTQLVLSGELTPEGAESYVAGLLDGARQFLAEVVSPRIAHETLADATAHAAAQLQPTEAL